MLTAHRDEQVSLKELREAAERVNMAIPAQDEDDYLGLVRAADVAVKHVERLPAYIDPRLLPTCLSHKEATPPHDLAKARRVVKPTPEQNPLGAWSHQCHISLGLASGPLAGRAVVVKDNISVAGVPITLGTFPEFFEGGGHRDQHPVSEMDASVVTRVLEAGGIVAGTATCENYSASPLSYTAASGPVENPWGRGHATGGSSSGCAALVAASLRRKLLGAAGVDDDDTRRGEEERGGEGILAIGGDQGGSIRVVSVVGFPRDISL